MFEDKVYLTIISLIKSLESEEEREAELNTADLFLGQARKEVNLPKHTDL
jgi:hypothetical protein